MQRRFWQRRRDSNPRRLAGVSRCEAEREPAAEILSATEGPEDYLAEGEGFEPPVPFRVQRFSRPPVSTTHTSLRG